MYLALVVSSNIRLEEFGVEKHKKQYSAKLLTRENKWGKISYRIHIFQF